MIKHVLIMIFVISSLISSSILAFQPLSEICNIEEGCDLVQNSVYAQTFGIKNSVYGVWAFSLLLILIAYQIFKPSKEKENLIKYSLIISSIVAIYFLFLQIFILQAYCKYCLIVDLSVIFATIISFSKKNKIKFV